MSDKLCIRCGTVGREKRAMRGSFLIEVVLWLFLILPGLIYSLWRLSTVSRVCARCGGNMIPLDSPMAQQILAAQGREARPEMLKPLIVAPEGMRLLGARKPMTPAKAFAIASIFIAILALIFLTSR